jgi:hypothetical protein
MNQPADSEARLNLPVGPLRRAGYVLADHGIRVAFATSLALPVVGALAGTGVNDFPRGDRSLFEPGGLMLLESMRALLPQMSGLGTTSFVSAFLFSAFLVVPHAVLLAAMSRGEKRKVSEVVAQAVARLPSLYSLTIAGFLLKCLVFGGLILCGGFVSDQLSGSDPRTGDLAFLVVIGVAALGWIAAGIATDLARAASVHGPGSMREITLAALRTLRSRPGRIAGSYALRLGSAFALIALAAFVTEKLDVSRSEPWRFVAVAVLHQLVALTLAFLRASVLAQTLAFVSARHHPRSAEGTS